MPARSSSTGFRMRRARGLAYSERYIAAPRPNGVATTMAITLTTIVCQTIVLRSNRPRRGNQPSAHNCDSSISSRKPSAFPNNDKTMAALTRIEKIAAAWKTTRTRRSRRFRLGSPLSSMVVVVTGHHPRQWVGCHFFGDEQQPGRAGGGAPALPGQKNDLYLLAGFPSVPGCLYLAVR